MQDDHSLEPEVLAVAGSVCCLPLFVSVPIPPALNLSHFDPRPSVTSVVAMPAGQPGCSSAWKRVQTPITTWLHEGRVQLASCGVPCKVSYGTVVVVVVVVVVVDERAGARIPPVKSQRPQTQLPICQVTSPLAVWLASLLSSSALAASVVVGFVRVADDVRQPHRRF